MRRYVFNGNIETLKREYYDVIIVGSGIAGLYTALNLDKKLRCAVLSKAEIEKSSSWLAQGGIAAVVSKEDKAQCHFHDTIVAGAGLCDEESVKVLVNEGPGDIQQLMAMNVPFDLSEEGDLHITREGGHTRNRIVHCGGDATGRETVKTLAAIASTRSNISLLENVFLSDILTSQDKAAGVIVADKDGYKVMVSPNVVISTGGIGQVYAHTTNPIGATGDGIAAALRAGANVRNMEFIQFHPTAFYKPDESGQSFLISEAVRGEGGILRNIQGECFMKGKHPMKDLAPRDIVTRAIAEEMIKTNGKYVFVDITSKSEEFLVKRFPTIFNECKKHGINISKQWIPVYPVQHYLMGGIAVNLHSMTNIKGLYVTGESSCTGVHGANRLASNSLLECMVFGRRCAQHINKNKHEASYDYKFQNITVENSNLDITHLKKTIKHIMVQKGGIARNGTGLREGLEQVGGILNDLNIIEFKTRESIELFNIAIIAGAILEAAVARNSNVGAHFRMDA